MEQTPPDSLPSSEERLRALLMASTDVVYSMSPDWSQLRLVIGRDFVEDTQQPIDTWLQQYIPAEDQARVMAAIDKALCNEAIFELEHRVVRKQGSPGWALSRAVPIADSAGNVVEWVGMATDITVQKMLEEQLKERSLELQKRSDDLARLAEQLTLVQQRERQWLADRLHDDLQQLLVAADLKVQKLWRVSGRAEEADRDAVHAILTEAIKTARTITRGLAPPFSLADNLSEALKWLAEHVRSNYGLSLEARIVGQIRPIPEAKGMLLYTAARELLLNVVKHAGTRSAQMEFYPRSDGIALVVRDAGQGFNPGESMAKHHEGFGLLSIRERVRLLGGEFRVDSAPGTGSEVAVTIPIPLASTTFTDAPASATAGSAPLEAGGAPPRHNTVRVVVADDHRLVRESLANLLDDEAALTVVGECADGREAVDAAARLQPDVVVMDVNMPQMDGVEATRIITRRHPAVKVIGVSIHSDAEGGSRMRAAGAHAYLSKTEQPAKLIDCILNCAGRCGREDPA